MSVHLSTAFFDVCQVDEARPVDKVLEWLSNESDEETRNYVRKRRRKPNWPRFDSIKDSISAFNLALCQESDDSGASETDAFGVPVESDRSAARHRGHVPKKRQSQIGDQP